MVKKEKSAGAVIYYFDKEESKPYFLLLKNTLKTTYWEFPKGHAEENESQEKAAIREAKEETSLANLQIIPGFTHSIRWFFKFQGELINKEAIYFLLKADKEDRDKAKISEEHQEIAWLDFSQAREKMKIKSNREMLEAAYKFIQDFEKQKTLF
jgi:8-oxo-dGTP pyrophosphatase MutT (NUDIX family)